MSTKLGQNFLVNKKIVQQIIEAANLKPDDFVLEIGPGKGVLTEELAKKAGKILAVEIDEKMIEELRKLKYLKNLKILKENVLEMELPRETYKVVANLPYYITSPIIRKFLETEFPPTEMILMVQKEVAERIVAKQGKMSLLSVSVHYYARPEILFYVGKENFDPVPEVDSAVIRITHNPVKSLRSHGANMEHGTWNNKKQTEKFFQIARIGFSAKRKMLINNLSNGLHLDKKEVEEKLESIGIKKSARAQELSVEDWKKLAKLF